MHKKTLLLISLFFIFALSACTSQAPLPTQETAPVIVTTGLLNGEWVRTEATLQRIASADQPIIQTPFTVLGTFLIIDETALTFTEITSGGYYLEGEQANLWDCNLAGAYTIPVQVEYLAENTGVVSWKPEVLDTLGEVMFTPWQNICVFSDIPTTLDDHTPLISSPRFNIEFELLDENTLQLFISFESEYVEQGTTVTVERTYIYERAD